MLPSDTSNPSVAYLLPSQHLPTLCIPPDQGVDLLGLDVVQGGHSVLDLLLGRFLVHDEHLHTYGSRGQAGGSEKNVMYTCTQCVWVNRVNDLAPKTTKLLPNSRTDTALPRPALHNLSLEATRVLLKFLEKTASLCNPPAPDQPLPPHPTQPHLSLTTHFQSFQSQRSPGCCCPRSSSWQTRWSEGTSARRTRPSSACWQRCGRDRHKGAGQWLVLGR